jgi:hypothetical protein
LGLFVFAATGIGVSVLVERLFHSSSAAAAREARARLLAAERRHRTKNNCRSWPPS